MQITLQRRSAVLKAHKAAEPITVQYVADAGDFLDVGKNETYKLSLGALITLEPEVGHEFRALPEVSILPSKFKTDSAPDLLIRQAADFGADCIFTGAGGIGSSLENFVLGACRRRSLNALPARSKW